MRFQKIRNRLILFKQPESVQIVQYVLLLL